MESENSQLWFQGFCRDEEDNNIIWFVSGWDNGLYKGDLRTGNTEFIMDFFEQGEIRNFLFNDSLKLNNILVFCPYMSEKVYLLDSLSRKLDCFDLEKSELRDKFSGIVSYKEKIILVPWCYEALVMLDLQNKRLTEVQDLFPQTEKNCFHRYFYFSENILYLFSQEKNQMVKIDVQSMSVEYVKIAIEDKIINVGEGKNSALILTEKFSVYRFDFNTNMAIKLWDVDIKNMYDGISVPLLYECNDKIIILLHTESKIMYKDLTNKIVGEKLIKAKIRKNSLWNVYRSGWAFVKKMDKGFCAFNARSNALIFFDEELEIIQEIYFKMSKKRKDHINIFRYMQMNEHNNSNALYPYNSLYTMLKYKDSENRNNRLSKTGIKIWEKLKEV